MVGKQVFRVGAKAHSMASVGSLWVLSPLSMILFSFLVLGIFFGGESWYWPPPPPPQLSISHLTLRFFFGGERA